MGKKLSGWIGRHSWTTHVEQGESYRVCAACGRAPRGIAPSLRDLQWSKIGNKDP